MNRSTIIVTIVTSSTLFFLLGAVISKTIFENYLRTSPLAENGFKDEKNNVNEINNKESSPNRSINVWVAGWDGQIALKSLKRASGQIDYISPVFYHLTESGQINETEFKDKGEILGEIESQNIKVTPLIFNDFDPKRVGVFLNSDNKDKTIKELVSLSKQNNYYGWDINWEQVSDLDQPMFIEFLRQTHQVFKENNLKLIVTVPAKTGDKSDWSGATGYNWTEISRNSDEVRIMAYDYHNQSTKPGPITPDDWYERVVQYAAKNIPKEKITISLPLYGYKWDSSGSFLGSTINTEAEKLKAKREILEGSVRYSLEGGQVVWTENRNTLNKKMELAESYGIKNFSFWRLGAESSDFWKADQN